MHVISNYTYQQAINSNNVSNMSPLMVSMKGPLRAPPPMGATESDIMWEGRVKINEMVVTLKHGQHDLYR